MTNPAQDPKTKLLDFIAQYMLQHNGATPTIDLMAREINATPMQVNLMLIQLENDGAIHFVSRKPLRIMLQHKGWSSMLQNNGGVINPDRPVDPERYGRFLDVEGKRHELARFIGDHEAMHGRGPTLREMTARLKISDHRWVWQAANILAKRGIITFGEGIPTRLTEKGRQFYGFKPEPKPETKVVIIERTKKMPKRKFSLSPEVASYRATKLKNRARDIGKFIFDYQSTSRTPPIYSEIAKHFGFSPNSGSVIRESLDVLVSLNLIEDRPFNAKSRYKFTEAGIAEFSPAAQAPATNDNAEPVILPPANKVEVSHIEAVVEPSLPAATPLSPALPDLTVADTSALVLELIERGYTVRKN